MGQECECRNCRRDRSAESKCGYKYRIEAEFYGNCAQERRGHDCCEYRRCHNPKCDCRDHDCDRKHHKHDCDCGCGDRRDHGGCEHKHKPCKCFFLNRCDPFWW